MTQTKKENAKETPSTKPDIWLKLLTDAQFDENYYEKIGFHADEAYEIILNNQEKIGIIMIDNFNPHYGYDCTFISWVNIYEKYQGKSYFRQVLNIVQELYQTEEIHFECPDDLVSIYLHLGAIDTGISELTENHKMILRKPGGCK